MSTFAIIIYELCYTLVYLGLLFSKSSFLEYFPQISLLSRLIALLILFSGFFVPTYLKWLRIRLTFVHYCFLGFMLAVIYLVASWCYYSRELRGRAFHSFLQVPPAEQRVETKKAPGVFRILCLGGSTTEGPGRRGYPVYLGEMLAQRYPHKRVEVVNAGRFFYSTQHSIIQYLFYLKGLEPDVILMFHAVNDLITSFTMPPFSSSPFRNDYGHFYGALARIRYPKTFEQFLARFFFADLLKPRVTPAPFSDFKSQDPFRRNLETVIEITRAKGIHLILSNQAHCYSEGGGSEPGFLLFQKDFLIDDEHYADEKSWYKGMELFNSIAKETALKYSIPFVDQASAFNGRRELFRDSVHMTPEGMRRLAGLFLEKIVQLKILDERDE